MPDSLVVAGLVELLGNGVSSSIPQCAGAVFRLGTGSDRGTPQPQIDLTASLVLDGERPFGRRAGNRTVTLPIVILAQDRQTLAGAREVLMQLIDQQTWTLTWTRQDGLPMILDCFRALPSTVNYELRHEQQFVCQMTISFQALPYGRSDAPVQLAFSSPFTGSTPPPPDPVTLDTFSSVSGANWTRSTQHVIGPYSAAWAPPSSDPDGLGTAAPAYSRSFAPADITGRTALSVWTGFTSRYYAQGYVWFGYGYWYGSGGNIGPVTWSVTLYDASGRRITLGVTRNNVQASAYGSAPQWVNVSIPLPAPSAGFDFTKVTGYTLKIFNNASGGTSNLVGAQAWIDHLQASPSSTSAPASIRGTVYTLTSIQGTAHAPLSLQFQQSSGAAFTTLVAHRPGPDAPASLTPFVTVGGGSDAPDGRQYAVTSLVSGISARFGGTYSMLLAASSWASPSSSRTVTVTVHQFEYSGGPSTTWSVSRALTPAADAQGGMVTIGELTLPGQDIAPDNTQAYFTVGVTSGMSGDRFLDLLVLDTFGETCWIASPTGYANYYLDEPGSDRDIGYVLGSAADRTEAVSVLGSAFVSGGPLTVNPGTANTLLVYSIQGAPSLSASYYARYYTDRIGQ